MTDPEPPSPQTARGPVLPAQLVRPSPAPPETASAPTSPETGCRSGPPDRRPRPTPARGSETRPCTAPHPRPTAGSPRANAISRTQLPPARGQCRQTAVMSGPYRSQPDLDRLRTRRHTAPRHRARLRPAQEHSCRQRRARGPAVDALLRPGRGAAGWPGLTPQTPKLTISAQQARRVWVASCSPSLGARPPCSITVRTPLSTAQPMGTERHAFIHATVQHCRISQRKRDRRAEPRRKHPLTCAIV